MKALIDPHHTDLFLAFQILFEKRLGWELYRPEGSEWYPDYYWHPIAEEALGNLTPCCQFDPVKHGHVLSAPQIGTFWKNHAQQGMYYRWMRLERVKELDLIICTSDRNEDRFWNLKQRFDLKCPILRYTGNRGESLNPDHFDLFLPAVLGDYERYVKSGLKTGILYHPEFNLDLYTFSAIPDLRPQIIRCLLNFVYHHREPGTPWEQWGRYVGFANEIGASSYMHGLGTPPPGVEIDLDVILDISLDKLGLHHLKDRSTWPNLRFNRGEPPNHTAVSDLMKYCNMVIHPKHSPPEGYGFIIHELAACGRPAIIPQHYKTLSASAFLQDRETCIYISGENETDKANFKWAMLPENNTRMGEAIYKRFKENVDFAHEARCIRALL